MEINLSSRHRKIVSGMFKAGAFKTPQAVVGEALRLLAEQRTAREKARRELARSVREAFRQIERGESIVADQRFSEWVCAEGRRRVASRRRRAS